MRATPPTRPNLSFEAFATMLATLGASTAIGCSATTPHPVQAHEVTPAPTGPGAQASCSANGCGGKAVEATAASAPATPPVGGGATAPSASASSAVQVQGTSVPSEVAASPPPAGSASATKASTAAHPPKKPVAAPPKASNVEASCGAGTCGSDPQKKVL